jgi:hypothetical protein
VTSFGGPLALAALYAPASVTGASAAAGLAMAGAVALFAAPLVIWLRYARRVNVLAIALDGVTLAHLPVPASSFAASAPAGALASSAGQTSLLYVCGSLPLFLGGELARPARTIRRGLTAAWLVTAVVVTAAVAPLAAAPVFTQALIPGMAVAERFAGHGFVFAVYPRFARQQHDRRLPAWALAVAATGFALYGLWVTIQHFST